MAKSKRGGRRPGAGRPRLGEARLVICPFRLDPDTVFLVQEYAKEHKVNHATALKLLILR